MCTDPRGGKRRSSRPEGTSLRDRGRRSAPVWRTGLNRCFSPAVSYPGSQPRLQPHGGHREAETRENRAGPAWPRGVPQSGRSAARDRVRAENGADPQHLVKLPRVGFPEGRGCAPPVPPHPDDFAVQSVLRPGGCQLQDTPFSALDSPPPPTKEGGITVPPRHERRGFSIPGKERCVEPPGGRPPGCVWLCAAHGLRRPGEPTELRCGSKCSRIRAARHGWPPALPPLVPRAVRGTDDQRQPLRPVSKKGRPGL